MSKKDSPSLGKQVSNGFIWVILLLLIIGLAGFGATSFGGSQTAVATVGDRSIDANAYFRAARVALRQDQQAQGRTYTMADPRAQLIAGQVRGELIAAAALENEAMQLGLAVGDELVARQIETTGAFQGNDGFSRVAFEQAVAGLGMTERTYIEQVRHETARFLIQNAVSGGIDQTASYADHLMNFVGQRRTYQVAIFETPEDAPDLPAPSDEDLQAYYEEHPEDFTLPERKRITYAWVTPDMLSDEVEVTDEQLQALYKERIDNYVQPARRLVERLAFQDEAAAQATLDSINSGESTFEDAVAARNLELSDIDLGEVTVEDLGENGEAIFALTEPGVVGPLATNLGPTLYRVNAILEARETPFEEVRDQLQGEAALDAARRRIDGALNDIDDLLASGATLEEATEETDLKIGRIDYSTTSEDPITGYPAFRRAANRVTEDNFPEVETLSDGGIFALRLDEIVPSELEPLDNVREAVIEGWEVETRLAALREEATVLQAQMGVGAAIDSGEALVETATQVTRDEPLPGLPATVTLAAFELETDGDITIVDGPEAVYLVQLQAIDPPDLEDQRMQRLQGSLQETSSLSLSEDILRLYANALVEQTGHSVNSRALTAVHAELP